TLRPAPARGDGPAGATGGPAGGAHPGPRAGNVRAAGAVAPLVTVLLDSSAPAARAVPSTPRASLGDAGFAAAWSAPGRTDDVAVLTPANTQTNGGLGSLLMTERISGSDVSGSPA